MKIESIKLRNFKSLKDLEINDIPDYFIVVGANGSGKSTLFDVFGFLKDCLVYTVDAALQTRGGFHEVLSRGTEDDFILIELKFSMTITNRERLVTYSLEIGEEQGIPVIRRELLRYKRGAYGSPYHFLDFSKGKGYSIANEEDFDKKDEELERKDQVLDSPSTLAIKGLGQFQQFKAASAFRKLIENWHISDFHINLARGSKDSAGISDHLSVSGDNLQLVANRLFRNYPDRFNSIIEAMKKRVPGVDSVEPKATEDGRLLLKFQDGSFQDPFIDKYVSDGTLKMFAYLVLLYDPEPHALLCVEEPENQLYPKLLWELSEEFRSYSKRGGQVFVSSHSPDFLNAARLNEVYWLVKEKGYTQVIKASDDKQISAYMHDGDQMGYLWKQGLFTGVDPQ